MQKLSTTVLVKIPILENPALPAAKGILKQSDAVPDEWQQLQLGSRVRVCVVGCDDQVSRPGVHPKSSGFPERNVHITRTNTVVGTSMARTVATGVSQALLTKHADGDKVHTTFNESVTMWRLMMIIL